MVVVGGSISVRPHLYPIGTKKFVWLCRHVNYKLDTIYMELDCGEERCGDPHGKSLDAKTWLV